MSKGTLRSLGLTDSPSDELVVVGSGAAAAALSEWFESGESECSGEAVENSLLVLEFSERIGDDVEG